MTFDELVASLRQIDGQRDKGKHPPNVNRGLLTIAQRLEFDVVATNAVRFAAPEESPRGPTSGRSKSYRRTSSVFVRVFGETSALETHVLSVFVAMQGDCCLSTSSRRDECMAIAEFFRLWE